MEYKEIPTLSRKICRLGLGTWAIGGGMWGGTDEALAIRAIHKALDQGINLLDTAPIYGFGTAEKIVGKALKSYSGNKDHIYIATKCGLNWKEENSQSIVRDSSKKRVFQEIEDSLKRLQVDCIDLYQVHWPDASLDFSETAEAINELLRQGKIRAIGVSNFSKNQMKEFLKTAPIHTLQSPYNVFESDLDLDEIPFCRKEKITILGYGSLCRGLLSGKMTREREFRGDDLRKIDPKFQNPRFSQYLNCVEKLEKWVKNKHHKSVLSLAIRWCLDKGIGFPLCGVRNPDQVEDLQEVWGWKLTDEDLADIVTIVVETISDPVGPQFMAPKEKKIKQKA